MGAISDMTFKPQQLSEMFGARFAPTAAPTFEAPVALVRRGIACVLSCRPNAMARVDARCLLPKLTASPGRP